MQEQIKIGSVFKSKETGKEYRLLNILNGICIIIEMNKGSLNLSFPSFSSVLDLVENKEFLIEDEEKIIFDISTLSEKEKEEFEQRKKAMQEVVRLYGPTFAELVSKKPKPEIKKMISDNNWDKSTFWRICSRYFESGFQDYSLINSKKVKLLKKNKYNYKIKTGKPAQYLESGTIITEEIESYFNDALNDYKSGRAKTMRSAYDKMNYLHFSKIELINGAQTLVLLSEAERPTIKQFRYYVNKHMTAEEKDKIKTSAQEQRNNKRLLLSDSLNGVMGPGDLIEIDAVEADVSLVSSTNKNQSIGRPIVYFMVDVYTRCIIAMSVAFDNNSVLALTNLFLNLSDDKKEYCGRYGINLENSEIWPSNFIPNRIRLDRGSDFKSKEFDRICVALGIEKQLVSGGSGSLKGTVEQSFHQMHSRQNVHLENYGLIEKRHDSKHHKESTLTIYDYTKMVINFVLFHNQQYDKDYKVTKEMIEKQIEPIPAILFKYGVNKYGHPRPIANKEQYLYDLLTPVKASISRRGISYRGLYYLPDNDVNLTHKMFEAGTKKIPFEVRIDKRNVDAVYYKDGNRLIKASLNRQITGNSDYEGLTWKEYEDYKANKGLMDAKGKVHNEQLSSYLYSVNESIVDNAKKDSYSKTKEISPNREEQKQLVSKQNSIVDRLDSLENKPKVENKKQEEKEELTEFTSWQDAIDDFNENF